jgi:hypothetical protein
VTAVAIVYDESALLAFGRGQISAGELISEARDNIQRVGVPATCLARAIAALSDPWDIEQLTQLITDQAVVLLPLCDSQGDQSAELLEVSKYTEAAAGDVSLGHAVAAALHHEAYVATTDPGRVAGVLPADWEVLDLGR